MNVAVMNRGRLLLPVGLGALALAAVTALLAGPVSHVFSQPHAAAGYDVARMALVYSTLPRLVIAVLCGAALGASGATLQQVLRNPLASPTTLGIDAGARLALALATLLMPSLFGLGRDAVAVFGSAVTTLVVFALVKKRGFSAISIVLAGLVISLYCGALSSILVLVNDRYLTSLFIWGSGSLSQQSWNPAISLAWRLGAAVLPLTLLVRPLSLLDIGDAGARSLGLSVSHLRLMAIGIAVALAAFVTSAVGVIGFIGLVAPILARVAGARRFGERLLVSTIVGALLLLLTDAMLQNIAGVSSQFVPTGAVTAVLGSPLLLLLLPRMKIASQLPSYFQVRHGFSIPMRTSATIAIAVLALLIIAAIFIGRGPSGEWQILSMNRWDQVMPWRLPRTGAAAAAGALLGVAGFVLQKLTNNEMASPEVLGVSAGAILAVALSLLVFGSLGPVSEGIAATAGGLAVLAAIIMLGRRSGFAPERILLAGIALNALIDAVVGVLSSTGDPRAVLLLSWMAGSTTGTLPADAVRAVLAAAVLIPASILGIRWLAILPMGGPTAKSLGVPLARSRFFLILVAAIMTTTATLIIGPLTFIGLMAPHIVLTLGIRQPLPSLLSAAAAGAGLMALADLAARTVAFPLQLPTGLVAAIIGAPFLMILLSRRGAPT
jgi:ABC-type Fe3+-siderophore transport system permease subunit